MFLIKKRRSADAQYWTLTLSNWKKQPPEVFCKNAALKIFRTFTWKHLCEIFKNTYFEEDLRTVAFELTVLLNEVIVWNFVSGSHLKPSRLNITKIPVAFKPDLWKNSAYMPSIYLTPTLSCEPRFCMFVINGYYTKSKHLWSLNSLLQDVRIYYCVLFD